VKQQVNFLCPSKLLQDFDSAVERNGRIPSRTAALHRVMERFIEENRKEAKT